MSTEITIDLTLEATVRSNLTMIVRDLCFQVKALKEQRPDEMWDVYDLDNWECMRDSVIETAEALGINIEVPDDD